MAFQRQDNIAYIHTARAVQQFHNQNICLLIYPLFIKNQIISVINVANVIDIRIPIGISSEKNGLPTYFK